MKFDDSDGKPESESVKSQADASSGESGLLTKRTLIVAAAGSAVIALVLMIWQMAQILLLVFASMLLALFLRTLADFISRHTPLSVPWSLAAVVLILLGIFALVLVLYGPEIADGFYRLFRELPSAPERLRSTLEPYEWGPAVMDALSRAGQTLVSPKQLAGIAGIFSTAFGALGSMLFVIVLSLYLAADPKTYINGMVRLFPAERRGLVHEAINRIAHALRWWLLGRIAAMAIVGLMIGIGLAILGIPFAFILGLVAALLDFIPNIGPLIAAVPALMVGLSQDGASVLSITALYLVVQALEGYLITPHIEERVVSLPPALLLTAQLLLGAGMGILGVLLASPLTVVVMVLVQMLYMRNVLGQQVDLP
jgi:predicted PurR-regulated permease PerM